MYSGIRVEVPVDGRLYYVTSSAMPDETGFRCPRCKRMSACSLIFTFTEILMGEGLQRVGLAQEMVDKIERVIRRRLVREGDIVTYTRACDEHCIEALVS